MEQEENLLHLLTQHPIILFLIGAVLILGLIFMVIMAVGKRTNRKIREDEKKGSN